MVEPLRKILTKFGQARRLTVRAQLTLGALQVASWVALLTISVGAVLLLRARCTRRSADDSTTVAPPGPPLLGQSNS
jgi:hypothetical protein